MENHSYNSIIGSTTGAPYINTLASQCGLATNYHNVDHPSLPNYLAATSGLSFGALGPFTSDCNPSKKCSTSAASIFSQVSWKAYEESMPSNCAKKNSGEYAVRHNPPPYYTTLAGCATNDVPYPQLAVDLASNSLPAFSFVTPNLIDDMHDGTVAQGDTWLAQNIPTILNSAEYQAGNVALFITWDEGEGGTVNDCATNTSDIGCHVATLVISPSTAVGTQSATLFNHYSLLGSSESLLGVVNLAASDPAGTTSMLNDFKL
jgi:phospholipase C